MNRFIFLAFLVAATLHNATGQAINANTQTAAPRVTTRPVARMVAQVVSPPTGLNSHRFNPNLPRMIAQPAINLQNNYLPSGQSSSPAFAALNLQRGTAGTIVVDPATRQAELRTLAALHQRRGIVTREGSVLDPATRQTEMQTFAAMSERRGLNPGQSNVVDGATHDGEFRTPEMISEPRGFGPNNETLATINPQRHVTNRDPQAGPRQDKPEVPKEPQGKKWHGKKDIAFDEAFRRHWHEWHDRNWWHDHCETIVFVATGYYFLDGSYWYPAWGYDPLQSSYDYDGPVYTYGNLLPDEVIANVQTALQNAGYFYGEITGSLGVDTRAAIANFQRDSGLQITGAIDDATVEALGLY
jgi:hypothetical protein